MLFRSTDRTVTYDTTAPTLTLEQAAGQVDPAKNSSISFTLSANESLDSATIAAADFTVTNGGTPTITGSGSTYTVTVTATAQGAVTVVPSGTFGVNDTAANTATTAGGTDRTVTYDSIAPTLTLQQAAGQADPANTSPVAFTLSATESLDGTTITASDFTVTNGGTPTISCTSTTCTVTTVATAEGVVSITVSPSFSVSDPAGNATVGATVLADTSVTYDREVTYDATAPTLTLAQAADQVDPAKNAAIKFTLSANETLDAATVTASDFTVTNGTISSISCSGSRCAISVTATTDGTVSIAPSGTFAVADLLGNVATTAGGTAQRTVVFDATAPTVTLAQAGEQADPTSGSAILFRLAVSEALDASSVTGADFTLTNGTVAAIDCTASTCTITVGATGQGAVTIAASGTFAVADLAGNAATTAGGTDRTVTYDTTAPTLTLAQAAAQADPAKSSPILFTLGSSEALLASSISAADFDVTNGTVAKIGRAHV